MMKPIGGGREGAAGEQRRATEVVPMKDLEALTGEHFQRLTAIKGGDWRTYPH